MLSSLRDMLFRSNISWIRLAPDGSPRLPGCSWVVTGLCHSSPQQSWGGDPGWAPLSRRRSLAPRLFLRLPICTISCGHAALFGSILCGSVIFGFCWFFKFFWVSCLFDLTVYEDFYNFFQMLLLTSLAWLSILMLVIIHILALPCWNLEAPTSAMCKNGLAHC